VQETYAKALKEFSSFRTGLKATATVPLDFEGEKEGLPAVKETPESISLQGSDGQFAQLALEQVPSCLSRGAAVWSRRDVVSGNLCHAWHPDGHSDVAFIACQKSVTQWPTATVSKRMNQTVNYGL